MLMQKQTQRWKFPCYFCSNKFWFCFGSFFSSPSLIFFLCGCIFVSEPVLPLVVPVPVSLLQKQPQAGGLEGEQRADGQGLPQPRTGRSLPARCPQTPIALAGLLPRPFQGASRYDPFSGTGNKGPRNGNLLCPSGEWELNIWNILMLNTVCC